MPNYFNKYPKSAQWTAATALLLLPLLLQSMGDHWVRTADICLLYVMMALRINIMVGYAGLLDLGYIAFYAVGAYVFALLGSPHLTEQFAAIATLFPAVLYAPWWLTIPFIALAIIVAVLMRPQGLWPAPQRGKSLEK